MSQFEVTHVICTMKLIMLKNCEKRKPVHTEMDGSKVYKRLRIWTLMEEPRRRGMDSCKCLALRAHTATATRVAKMMARQCVAFCSMLASANGIMLLSSACKYLLTCSTIIAFSWLIDNLVFSFTVIMPPPINKNEYYHTRLLGDNAKYCAIWVRFKWCRDGTLSMLFGSGLVERNQERIWCGIGESRAKIEG